MDSIIVNPSNLVAWCVFITLNSDRLRLINLRIAHIHIQSALSVSSFFLNGEISTVSPGMPQAPASTFVSLNSGYSIITCGPN
jgi:hypothetical protein